MLPDINKKCNKDMCITTCYEKTLQLTLGARHAKTSKSGISPLRFRNSTLLYHCGNADWKSP